MPVPATAGPAAQLGDLLRGQHLAFHVRGAGKVEGHRIQGFFGFLLDVPEVDFGLIACRGIAFGEVGRVQVVAKGLDDPNFSPGQIAEL